MTAIALWAVVAVFAGHAYMTSVAAVTFDARHTWAPLWCVPPFLLGHLAGWWACTRRGTPFGAQRHALALLLLALCVEGMAQVAAHTSVTVLREAIPPGFGVLYPLLCLLGPILLRRSAGNLDAPEQALILALAATTLSGALFLLEGSAAWSLAGLALLLQLPRGQRRLRDRGLAAAAALFLLLLTLATVWGRNRIQAQPSWTWALALGALGLAVALRAGDGRSFQRLLATPVAVAVLIASMGSLLTLWLALRIHPAPALHTRLVLFQQHPNFLAPFFGLHAVLALGLALSAQRRRLLWLAACVLLCLSTLLTQSRTGLVALLAGLLALPAWYGLRRLALRGSLRRWALGAGALLVVLAAGALLADLPGRVAGWTTGVDRFEKSLDFRLDAWRNSAAIVADQPLTGIGPGTFISMARFEPGSRFFNEPTSPHPHDVFLYVAQAAGLPALLVFLIWVGLLARRLWRDFADPSGTLPGPLPACLLAACVTLLLANLLDLGLSLHSVAPAPLFLITGLALGGTATPGGRRLRPASAGLGALAAGTLLLLFGLDPVRARTRVEQAQLLWYQAADTDPDHPDRERARAALRRALELDPVVPRAHEHLSRWLEARPEGFLEARRVLELLVRQAPLYGPSHSLLGHLYQRAGMLDQAAEALGRAVTNAHGGRHLSRDRADRIACLARAGRRDEALEAMVDAIGLDKGVIGSLPWSRAPGGERILVIGGDVAQEPIDLVGSIQILFARHLSLHAEGLPVGRRAWMEATRAFRDAGRDDLALTALDYLWDHVDEVERHSILAERGQLALDRGEHGLAAGFYQQAFQRSGLGFFREREQAARRALGEADPPGPSAASGLRDLVEILDQPQVFQTVLEERAAAAVAAGRHDVAADQVERVLLFEDDPIERARLLQRAGRLYRKAADPSSAARCFEAGLTHLSAKPWPAATLAVDLTSTLPEDLAQDLISAWSESGLAGDALLARAWKLSWFFRSDSGPALFRLGLFRRLGRPDKLLREADMLLLAEPQHRPALWARLDALEGLGRHDEAALAMRTLAEIHGEGGKVQRAFDRLVAEMQYGGRRDDPRAWFQVAVLQLLRGHYAEAAELFGDLRQRLSGSAAEEATAAGWQARAALFAGQVDGARQALAEALTLDPDRPQLRLRLETLP